jgi:hypothetical protein
MMNNQAAVVPALKRGIVEALGIEPVGSQHIVVQKNANGRLQGLSEDGPVLYLRMWDKHAQGSPLVDPLNNVFFKFIMQITS